MPKKKEGLEADFEKVSQKFSELREKINRRPEDIEEVFLLADHVDMRYFLGWAESLTEEDLQEP